MIAWIRARLTVWLGRKPVQSHDAAVLQALMAEWTRRANARGPGSDIAAAKIAGAQTAIMYLAPVQNLAAKADALAPRRWRPS